jgi:hypothetical protein
MPVLSDLFDVFNFQNPNARSDVDNNLGSSGSNP